MNESVRTLAFVAIAAVSIVVAIVAAPTTALKPVELGEHEVGKEFYPGFKDPNEPTSLRVVSFNEAQAISKMFSVELKDGVWTIPSHHNYPADGLDRLAKTSASAIGIKKDELRTTNPQDFAELGVVDPLDDDTTKLKGRGQRITLSKDTNVLMDLIIGKQLKDRPGYYFVRVPDKNPVYVAKIDIDLSTQFGDWVETDLLKLNRDDLIDLVANNYSVDEAVGRIVPGDNSHLHRGKPSDPWTLQWRKNPTDSWQELDGDKEELDTAKVNTLVDTLDNLKLTGVRPKPAGLRDDLKKDEGIQLDQLTMLDLRSKGFMFTNRGDLVSNEGEFIASTDKGIEYVLRFGEVFTGDAMEVEAGIEADRKEREGKKDEKATEGDEKEADKKSDEKKSNRYLFVQAQFNEEALGPKPKKPRKPGAPAEEEEEPAEKPAKEEESAAEEKPAPKEDEKPEEPADEAKPEEKKTEAKKEDSQGESPCSGEDPPESKDDEKPADKADAKKADEAPADETKPAEKKDEDKKPAEDDADKKDADKKDEPAKPDEEKKDDAKKDDTAKSEEKKDDAPKADPQKEYEEALKKYKADLKIYEDKVKSGKEQVAKLNQRFADWYYVISADSFEKIHVSRKDLVKEKAPAAGAEKAKPDEAKPDSEKPDEEKPDADKPESESKPDAEKKDGEAEKKDTEKKDAEKKPADDKSAAEKPSEKKPAEEKPAKEEPTAEKPADKPEEKAEKPEPSDKPKADDQKKDE